MQILPKALVQYKKAPAIVVAVGDKIEITLMSGTTKRVRDKDVILIHSGPLTDFDFMKNLFEIDPATIEETCELLEDETTPLSDLAGLLCAQQSPAHLWSLWKLVETDTYFSGTSDGIICNDLEQAKQKIAEAVAKAEKKSQEKDFHQRLKDKKPNKEDLLRLTDIEELALGVRDNSALFSRIGEKQNAQNAHVYLNAVGYWDVTFNPYPKRQGLSVLSPEMEVPVLEEIERKDLSHLACYAIDDEGNTDPDDAISVDGEMFWVHVADVASVVAPDSPLDQQAQSQAGNLYLPETTVHMLPHSITEQLGLGLHKTSPALSIGFTLNDALEPEQITLCQSMIKVSRISYAQAEARQDQADIATLYQIAKALKAKRMTQGAIQLQFPEVKVSVDQENKVDIQNLVPYESRGVVMEFMLLAGAVCGQFAIKNDIPFIFSTQAAPNSEDYNPTPETFSQMHGLRRMLSRSRPSEVPEPHHGLGLPVYTQVTSPLRRYVDLSNHQQLLAYLQGKPLLSIEEVKEKIMHANRTFGALRKAERESNNHWKCIYLLQNKSWQGEAHITTLEERKVQLLVPALGMEMKLKRLPEDQLDQVIQIKVSGVNVPSLEPRFTRSNV